MISIKSEKEIDAMRESCHIVRETLRFVERHLHAGMSTKDVDQLVYDYIKSCGAIPSCLGYEGYPASACVSVNEVVVHGIPSEDQILKNGDLVSVDLCVLKNGWQGDGARTFIVGEGSEEDKKLVEVTRQCFFEAIDGLKAGSPLYDIGYRVQSYAESHGFGVVRSFTGHGIGREMHEDPSVPNFGKKGTGMRLKAGMVICIEPMITAGDWRVVTLNDGWTSVTRDHSKAAHYENTIVIREDGVEILTV
ncbi:MAG: type I methionyl aminopeptidase [Clostridia bacterium]|nr:type I methionyl aminopeptidase [Clostridia bacterium]